MPILSAPLAASLDGATDTRWWMPTTAPGAVGRRTRGQLMRDALREVGAPHLMQDARGWLNAWLQKQYDAFPWPFLTRRVSNVELPALTDGLVIGCGSGVPDRIRRLLDPVDVFTADRRYLGRARIRSFDFPENDIAQVNVETGVPLSFRVEAYPPNYGMWTLIPQPFPKDAHLLTVRYLASPTLLPLDDTGDDYVPIYPNEESMVLAIQAPAYRFMKEWEMAGACDQKLAARASNDRVAYGMQDGTHDVVGLDRSVFR